MLSVCLDCPGRPRADASASKLIKRDIVHNVKLRDVISAAIAECQQMNGGPEAFSQKVLIGIDTRVLQELEAYLSGAAKGGD